MARTVNGQNERVLSWNTAEGQGAFQIKCPYGGEDDIWSDLLKEKPDLGFEYHDLYYVEFDDAPDWKSFHIAEEQEDGTTKLVEYQQLLTEEEIASIQKFIIERKVTIEYAKAIKGNPAQSLLDSTDVAVIKALERGDSVDTELTEKREKARYYNGLIKRAETVEELEEKINEWENN